jgi:ABC-type nitrate/sulfonate/bicarbonate transport system substrate-binding protein
MHPMNIFRAAVVLLALAPGAVAAEPLKIRVGHGPSAEDNLWLMKARPDLGTNQGKAYTLEFSLFRGSEPRYKAFEAGELDLTTGSAASMLFAASKGVDLKIIASVSMNSRKGYETPYVVKQESPIHTLADLKGKTLAINGFKSDVELTERRAATKGGLDPNKDVKFAVVGFPNMGTAVRSGLVDLAVLPLPFGFNEMKKGGLLKLFDAYDISGEDDYLEMIATHPAYIAAHRDVLRALLADFVATTVWYNAHLKEAREDLIKSQMVLMKPEEFLDSPDFYRDPTAKPDVKILERQQDVLIQYHFQDSKVDVAALVDAALTP